MADELPNFKYIPFKFNPGYGLLGITDDVYHGKQPEIITLTCHGGPLDGEEIVTPPEAKGRDYFFVVRQATLATNFVGIGFGLGANPSKPMIKFKVERGRYQLEKINGYLGYKFKGWRKMGWHPEMPEIFGIERIAEIADHPWVFPSKTQESK